jgi:hypothetical protein
LLAIHHQDAAILKQRSRVTPVFLSRPIDPINAITITPQPVAMVIVIKIGSNIRYLADDFVTFALSPNFISVILSLMLGRGDSYLWDDHSYTASAASTA